MHEATWAGLVLVQEWTGRFKSVENCGVWKRESLSISEATKHLGSGITSGVWVQDWTGLIYWVIQMLYANELYTILSFVDLLDMSHKC